jgi:hypothetical protein
MASRALLLWAILMLPGATMASPVPGPAAREAATSTTGPVYILPEPVALVLTGIGLTAVVWRMKRARAR